MITLALGIGVPTAVFTIVRGALLTPLPYPASDRIVRFRMEGNGPAGKVSFDALPASMALNWVERSNTVASLALFNDRALTLVAADGPFRLRGISATPNLFSILGTSPTLGVAFADATVDPRQIVLSHATWTRFFQSDPAIAGKPITLDGDSYRVSGVMPAGFDFPSREAEFWVPQVINAGGSRGMVLPAVARLAPQATVAMVKEEGQRELDNESGDRRSRQSLHVETLRDQMVGGVERVLWVLLGAVGCVLVIATVNVALLLLTRGAEREREFSIRLALGGGRPRLLRQLFTEGLALGLAGGVLGIGIAWLTLTLLLGLAPPELSRLSGARIDVTILIVAVALTMFSSVAFGALSAGKTLAIDAIRALGAGGESRLVISSVVRRRYLNVLAGAGLALTTVLLVGAGLLLRSFAGLVSVDAGFEPGGALAFQVNLPSSRYPSEAARMAYHSRLLETLRRDPAIRIAGLATTMPGRQPTGRFGFSSSPEIMNAGDPFSIPVVDVHMVTEGFMEAAGLRLLEGRFLSSSDGPGSEPVAVISESWAKRQFPQGGAVGRTMYSGTGDRRVAGVVADVISSELGAPKKPAVYLPLSGNTDVLQWFATITAVVRTDDAAAVSGRMREAVLGLDPASPPFRMRPLEQDTADIVAGPRFSATALGAFALVALVMAVVGIYGVMAYAAGLRVREIGVRLALGATRGQIVRLMTRDGLIVAIGGLAGGAILAAWLSGSLTGLLHEVTPIDPVTLAIVAVVLFVSALAAAFVPAARATRLTALEALRKE